MGGRSGGSAGTWTTCGGRSGTTGSSTSYATTPLTRPNKSRVVRAYLAAWGGRPQVHFMPKYAPDASPVEEVWWHLHEAVTRDHRCESMQELIELTMSWLDERQSFRVRRHIFNPH